MSKSIGADRVEEIDIRPTLADGLAGQIDEEALAIGRASLDEIVTVSEEEIGRAILWLLDEHGLKVEGAGAVGVAAILAKTVRVAGLTVVVVSGGNIDPQRVEKLRASRGKTDPSLGR
jgi:threonine dehydratase